MDIDCECCVPPPPLLPCQRDPRQRRKISPRATAPPAPPLCCAPCASEARERGGGARFRGDVGVAFSQVLAETADRQSPLIGNEVSRTAAKAWGVDGNGNPAAAGGLRGALSSEAFGEDGKVLFTLAFGNVTAIDTSEGLLMIDTGAPNLAGPLYKRIRQFSGKPVRAVIYTHGHFDHAAFHALPFEREHVDRGYPRTQVIAHENVPARFDRYKATAGYNMYINDRQFQVKGAADRYSNLRYPDTTFSTRMSLTVGTEEFELIHAKGETDDSTIIWSPRRKFLWSGDLWIWNVPNCGNPQKVQRYPMEWSAALKSMADFGAEVLFPGHGPPIIGAASIRQAFLETAEFLDSIIGQCMDAMNAGLTLNQLLHTVKIPDQSKRVYLRSTYDDPRFIVSNMWRRYAGWWDQDPAHLLPADNSQLAVQICEAAGGPLKLAEKALEVLDKDIATATQLVEYASVAAPGDAAVHRIRAEVYRCRKVAERSLMAQSIFADAERASLRILGKL